MKPAGEQKMQNGLTSGENDELQILEYIRYNKRPLTPCEQQREAELENKKVRRAS